MLISNAWLQVLSVATLAALFPYAAFGIEVKGNDEDDRSLVSPSREDSRLLIENESDSEDHTHNVGALFDSTLNLFGPNSTFVVGINERTIMRPEGPRYYEMTIPSMLSDPPALILNFHSFFTAPIDQLYNSGFLALSNQNKTFMAAFPAGVVGGLQNAFSAGPCCGYFSKPVDDLGFVRAIIDDIKLNMRINPRKIYATGYSQGAAMAIYLSYSLNDQIAAISNNAYALSDIYYQEALKAKQSNPNFHPVPVLGIHGYYDKFYCWEHKCLSNLIDFTHEGGFNNAQFGWHRFAEFYNCTGEPVTIEEENVTKKEENTTKWISHSRTEYIWIKAYESCDGGVEVRQILNNNDHGGETLGTAVNGFPAQMVDAERIAGFLLRWSLPDSINVTVPDWWP